MAPDVVPHHVAACRIDVGILPPAVAAGDRTRQRGRTLIRAFRCRPLPACAGYVQGSGRLLPWAPTLVWRPPPARPAGSRPWRGRCGLAGGGGARKASHQTSTLNGSGSHDPGSMPAEPRAGYQRYGNADTRPPEVKVRFEVRE